MSSSYNFTMKTVYTDSSINDRESGAKGGTKGGKGGTKGSKGGAKGSKGGAKGGNGGYGSNGATPFKGGNHVQIPIVRILYSELSCQRVIDFYLACQVAWLRSGIQKDWFGFHDYPDALAASHYPTGYGPYITAGDGLCYIHAVVNTVLMHWYSLDASTGSVVNQWLNEFRDFIRPNMPNGVLLMNLDQQVFRCETPDLKEVLYRNLLLAKVIVFNILIYMLHNWENPALNRYFDGSERSTFQNSFILPMEYRVTGIEMTINAVVRGTSIIKAVDNFARVFVMDLLGIRQVQVVQFMTHQVNRDGSLGEDMRRPTDPLVFLTERITDDSYNGFDLELPRPPMFDFGTIELSMAISTHNTTHYEMLLSRSSGKHAVPCVAYGELLPVPGPSGLADDMIIVNSAVEVAVEIEVPLSLLAIS